MGYRRSQPSMTMCADAGELLLDCFPAASKVSFKPGRVLLTWTIRGQSDVSCYICFVLRSSLCLVLWSMALRLRQRQRRDPL